MAEKKKVKQSPRPWARYAKRIALSLTVLVLGVLFTFPFWSLWVAKPLARSFAGIEIDSLSSLPSSQWRAEGVSWTMDGVELTAEEVELPSATQLLLSHFSLSEAREPIVVSGWVLKIEDSQQERETPSAEPITLGQILQIVEKSLGHATRYLSSATLNDGLIVLNGKEFLGIETATASSSAASAQLTHLPSEESATIALANLESDVWQLAAASSQHPLSIDFSIHRNAAIVELSGTATSTSNTARLTASWPSEKPISLPRSATLEAESIELDQRYPFWKDAPPLTLDLSADWTDERYGFRIQGLTTDSDTEEVTLRLAGEGTLEEATISEAEASLPWLNITSTQPIVFDFNQDDPVESAQISALVDFSQLPFIEATGSATATLRTAESPTGDPLITATIQGEAISFYDTTLDSLNSNIEYSYKVLNIKQLTASTTNGSKIDVTGEFDVPSRTLLAAAVDVDLYNESERLRNLLPQIEWERITAKLESNGPVQNPDFSGTLEVKSFETAAIHPIDIQAEIAGSPRNFQAILKAQIPNEKLTATFHAVSSAESLEIEIAELELESSEKESTLTLTQPANLSILYTDTRITIDSFFIEGSHNFLIQAEGFVIAPSLIQGSLKARMIDPRIADNWVKVEVPPLFVEDVSATVDLSDQGLITSTQGLAKWTLADNNSVDLSWSIRSDTYDEHSISIDDLKVGSNAKHILAASGVLPVSAKLVQFSPAYTFFDEQEFALTLQSSPHPDFWRSVEKYFPIALTKPVARAELKGTLARPEGFLELQLARLNWNHPEHPEKNLELTNVATSIIADSQAVRIEKLAANAGNNSLEGHAVVPLKHFELINLFGDEQPFDLENVNGQAQINIQDLTTLRGWLPPMLRTEGQATLKANLEPGNITAEVDIKNLATRPFPPLGALSQISGKVNFDNGLWKSSQLTGLAEGSPFSFSGEIDMSDLEDPAYDLRFKSDEFPLVRDSGLLLSGNVDLSLVSTGSSQTILKGKVHLTKGLFLVEPDLLASSTKTVQSRPPYFSVEQEPFNDWDLDLRITGDKFLRVSNSFFEGILSADFSLEGTLGSPLLVGRAIADDGYVFFPASSLRLTRGQALITREQPSVLQLDAAASGTSFAYDINLTISGPVESPDLIITTNPALTHSEALLLLTTGTLPNTNTGELAQNSATSLGIFIGTGLFRKLSGNTRDLASKLNVEVGQDVSLQGKPTIDATYQLTDTLEVEGEYDKRDEFNANFKWTFFEK